MTTIDTVLVVLVVVLVLVTAYLAAIETVLARLNVVRALRLAEEGARGSSPLLWLTEHRATSLNVLLVATVTIRVVLAAVATVLGTRLGDGLVPVVLAVVIVVALNLVVGEVAPRTLALRHLEATGLGLAASARILVRALKPVAGSVVSIGRALVPRRDVVSGPYASDDELRALESDDDDQDDELEPEERAMIRSIFELADTLAREIMTPRPDMVTVAADAPLDEVVETVLSHGFSRLPVHDPQDTDTMVGVVHAKDVLRQLASGATTPGWDELVRDPAFVPETKRCDDLLRDLQATAVHLALVVDEHGELAGLVTIEDILEEIVGEIVDEHDREEPLVVPLDDGALLVDARLGVDDLNELLGSALPEEGWDTVGGLVFGILGRIPAEGESVELDGTTITVEQVQGRRVGKVLVSAREGGASSGRSEGDAEAGDTRSDRGRPTLADPGPDARTASRGTAGEAARSERSDEARQPPGPADLRRG